MIKIAISDAAFAAIAQTLLRGSVGCENEVDEQGQRLVWLNRTVADRLRAMGGAVPCALELGQRRRLLAPAGQRGGGVGGELLAFHPLVEVGPFPLQRSSV